MIKKQGNKYVLYSKNGKKKLGTYSSKAAALKREKQIQYFKNNKK